jgi:hypothetical protein
MKVFLCTTFKICIYKLHAASGSGYHEAVILEVLGLLFVGGRNIPIMETTIGSAAVASNSRTVL